MGLPVTKKPERFVLPIGEPAPTPTWLWIQKQTCGSADELVFTHMAPMGFESPHDGLEMTTSSRVVRSSATGVVSLVALRCIVSHCVARADDLTLDSWVKLLTCWTD